MMKKIIAMVISLVFAFSSVSTIALAKDTRFPEKMDKEQILSISALMEPHSLDFTDVSSSDDFFVYYYLMEGLTRTVDNGKVKPGIAEKWETSADGLTWTFHLRDAKWTDGKAVTANDFVYGVQRMLEPKKNYYYSYSLYDIKGATEYQKGLVNFSEVGISATDEKTVKFTLKYPVVYFPYLTSTPAFGPVRKDQVEKFGENYNLDINTMITNGPFVMSEWVSEEKMTFTKNKSYWDEKSILLQQVNMANAESNEQALEKYNAGMTDVLDYVSVQNCSKIKKEELQNSTDGVIFFWEFNCADKVLKNKNVRKALTLAIDRKTLLKKGGNTEDFPVCSFVPPNVILDANGKAFSDASPAYFADNDKKLAKQYLEKGLKELKLKKLPKLEVVSFNSETSYNLAKVAGQMWKQTLGVNIEVLPLDSPERTEKEKSGQYQIIFSGWGPDYPDAMTNLDPFTSDASNNERFNNTKYDELIRNAKAESNAELRSKMLHEAEAILMDEMPVGPLYLNNKNWAVRTYVKNISKDVFGPSTNFLYAYIDGKH